MATLKDYIHLHFLVFIWGFTAILGLLISLPPVEVVFYRTLIAVLGIYIVIKIQNRPLNIGKINVLKILSTGALIAAHWILFFASARVSNASVCLAGMSTATLWTSILEPLILRKKLSYYELGLGILVMAGLSIIFSFEFSSALGLILAVISAMLSALFTVINSKFAARYDHYSVTLFEMIGANLSIILFLPAYWYWFTNGEGIQLTMLPMDLVWLLILAGVCTVYAYSASVELMKRISPFTMNLAVNLEPVYGIILALLIFKDTEKMNPGFYLGALVILAAVLSYPLVNKWRMRKLLRSKLSASEPQ